MNATHFTHPFRHFPGQVIIASSDPVGLKNILVFKDVGGDKGLRHAVEFFWNAKGISWSASMNLKIKATQTVLVNLAGPPSYGYEYDDVEFSASGNFPTSGSHEIAPRLYYSTNTAAFTPFERCQSLSGYYEGSGAEFIKDFLKRNGYGFGTTEMSWRGKSEFKEDVRPAYTQGASTWYDHDWIQMEVSAGEIVFSETLDRYGLSHTTYVQSSCGRNFQHPYTSSNPSVPEGETNVQIVGFKSFRLERTSNQLSGYSSTVTLPPCFEPAFLNAQNIPSYDGVAYEAHCNLTLGIPYWTYD